jgi:hypothetical protein
MLLILMKNWIQYDVIINPFRLACLEKFPQPGQRDLNACRATKWSVLPEKLVQQGDKVKKQNVYLHFRLSNS